MMPTTVVVPLDGSPRAERALGVARPLARELGAGVVVMAKPWYGEVEPTATQAYLDAIVAFGEPPVGGPVDEAKVVQDLSAAEAIQQVVEDASPALLCMTTHGRGRLRWAVAGSVAEDVIRAASAPLVLLGPHARATWPGPTRRVVVCVDGAATDRRSTEIACQWARALDLEICLLSVYHPLDVEAERPELRFGPLEELAKEQGLSLEKRQVFRSSFVAGALADVAEDDEASLLVMAAHHHSAAARLALGSTTMATVHMAPCPVLVIPPET
jgi:nucleotide-binding universal stress UspA family protein